ncbi:MAG: HAMP domain-containing histidine kinase [Saprospiraceae bacterium]|nr:HAMP domain-containing histidine kinase [Saprospiraceae bacterium]
MFLIFIKGNNWKILLMTMGAALLLFTILYSNFLAESLKKNEEKNILLFKQALEEIISQDVETSQNNIEFFSNIIDSFPLPVVFEDESGQLEGQKFSDKELSDPNFLLKKKKEFLASGELPIKGSGYATFIYCFNSPLLTYIKLFPLVQGLMVGLYIALGYFLFNSSRKAEQNRVWAGMAKETAHQLGTPISAILGWIEYLKESYIDKPDGLDVINELKKDVDRLELVADRFSKIGSEPVLQQANIYEELIEVKDYLQRRSPRKIIFKFTPPEQPISALVNKHLFAWVIENLVRNSLDAMDMGIRTFFSQKNHRRIPQGENLC